MKLFDCHVHVEEGLEKYDIDSDKMNIIFNTIDSYQEHSARYSSGNNFISLVFDFRDNMEFVLEQISKKKVHALKIHTRFQEISDGDHALLCRHLGEVSNNLPVIYDAFYFGKGYKFQPNLFRLIDMLATFPNRKFIIAHAGGYEILKYFFHLREFTNVYYDLSLSLQYLHDSSCFADLKKLIRYTDKKRLLFGSDFFYGSPSFQKSVLEGILEELKITREEREMIFFNNAWSLFSPE